MQRELEQAERDRRQDQGLEAGDGEEVGGPPADLHRLAAAEGRQPVQHDREDQDQQDAEQERRQRHAEQRHRLQQLARPVFWIEAGIDAHRHAEEQHEDRGAEGELEGRRHALEDHAADRLGGAVAQAEIAARGVRDEAQELHGWGIIQPQLLAQHRPVLHGGVLADHGVDGVADVAEQREGDQSHRQQHGDGLQHSSQDKGNHDGLGRPGAGLAGKTPERNVRLVPWPLRPPPPSNGGGRGGGRPHGRCLKISDLKKRGPDWGSPPPALRATSPVRRGRQAFAWCPVATSR